MRILLIDEDREFQETLEELIGKGGLLLDYVNSFPKAQRRLKVQSYDLVLVELCQSNRCNLDVISSLKLATLAPIVIVTRQPSLSTAIVATKLGADNYFSKSGDIRTCLAPYLQKRLSLNTSITTEKPVPIETLCWKHMQKVLQDMKGNISAAARALGVNRRTLHRKINQHTPPVECEKIGLKKE